MRIIKKILAKVSLTEYADLQLFTAFVKSLPGNIALFGYNNIAKKLINRFPGKFPYIVTLEENVKLEPGIPSTIKAISPEEFEKDLIPNVVIVDNEKKYDYLQLIYQIMYRNNLDLFSGMQIRYKYSYYIPQKYDFAYIKTRDTLPMEFTIPHDAAIRLIDCVKATAALEGDILELGTGYGGSTYLIADTLKRLKIQKHIYTVDRFKNTEYLPNLSFETVKEHLKIFNNIEIIQGKFVEQLKNLDISKVSFCFYDEYAVPGVLRYVYPKIVKGGFILIDNYSHGCNNNWGKPMADLFFADKTEKIIRVGGTQGLVVKH